MNSDDLDLDRRLGELFQAPALDLAPRAGATSAVLIRVRQARRRRRAMQVAVPALAAAVVAGVLLSVDTLPTLGAPAPAPPAAVPTVPAAPGELEMAGTAVGPLRLGMSTAQAEATGLLTGPGTTSDSARPDCLHYSAERSIQLVEIGPRGVHRIMVSPFIHTPQGIAVGDEYKKLHAGYPASVPAVPTDADDGFRVPVPGQTGAWYVFELEQADNGQPPTQQTRITSVSLTNDDPGCD
jgi:hypothetical protein